MLVVSLVSKDVFLGSPAVDFEPMQGSFLINVDHSTLVAGSKTAVLGHRLAAVMLAGLVDAANRSQSLQLASLLQLINQKDPRITPDRTAIARALRAVQNALGAVIPDGVCRISYAARCKTVGPWTLSISEGELWRVQTYSTGSKTPQSCVLQFCASCADWAAAAQALALADDFMASGNYADCRDILVGQFESLTLTTPAQCLWLLRLVRCNLRMGDSAQTKLRIEQIVPLLPMLQGVFAKHVAAEIDMLQQRWKFNAEPVATSMVMPLDVVIASAQSAPSAQLLMQAENLKGLALRRLLATRLAKGLDCHMHVESVLQTTCTAYFWSCVAQDGYYQQAIAINMGYLLHWLSKHNLLDAWQTSLGWFGLARMLVDRFNLPQDSAWDHIMIGTAYMESLEARASLQTQVMVWPDSQGPDTEAFYLRAVELAQNFGDARQRIMALDLLAQHYQHIGCLDKLADTRKTWLLQTKLHPQLVQDMALDK